MQTQLEKHSDTMYRLTPLIEAFYSVYENSSFTLKLFYSFVLSLFLWFPAAIVNNIASLLMPNFDFFVIITVVLTIDLVFGIMKWWMRHKFDPYDMAVGFLRKVAVCYAGMVIFGSMGNLPAVKEHPDIQSYINLLGQLIVFSYISLSALVSMHFVSGGTFGNGIIKRFKRFNENADVGELIKDKDKINVITETTTEGDNKEESQ